MCWLQPLSHSIVPISCMLNFCSGVGCRDVRNATMATAHAVVGAISAILVDDSTTGACAAMSAMTVVLGLVRRALINILVVSVANIIMCAIQ